MKRAIGLTLCALLLGCTKPVPVPTPPTPIVLEKPPVPAPITYPWDNDVARESREGVWMNAAIMESKRKNGYAIIIAKEEHRLDVYHKGKRERTMRVELGHTQDGTDKVQEGDRRTPEGLFRIDRMLSQRTKPKSHYHRFLGIDYPTTRHQEWFKLRQQNNIIAPFAEIGNRIGIHGQGKDYRPTERSGYDWTLGCIAVTNHEIEWLYERATIGTPVAIVRDLD